MARAVGLHISKDFVRAAEIEGSAKRVRVRNFVDVPIDSQGGLPPEEAVAAALERVFKEHRVPRSPLAIGLDSGDAMFRDLTVPFTRDDHLRRTIKYELETHLHSHNPDELVVDYLLLDRTEKDSRILVSALPKALVGGRLKQLEKLRVDPVYVDIDASGLLNALAVAGVLEEHPNVALVHVDGVQARFLVVEGGKLRLARSVLLPAGEDGPPSARLAQELGRTLFQAAPQEPTEVVYLSGDLAESKAVRAAIAERAAVPCEPLDIFARCQSDLSSEAGSGAKAAVPVGLAYRALAGESVGLDFRKEEFSYERMFDSVKEALVATALFVFVMVGLMYIGLRVQTQAVDHFTATRYLYNLAEIHDRIPLSPPVMKKQPGTNEYDGEPIAYTEGQTVLSRIKRLKDALEGGRGGNSAVTRSATRYWADLYGLLGQALVEERGKAGTPDKPWLKVTSINFAVNPPARVDEKIQSVTLRLTGEISDVAVFSSLIRKLNESGRFTNVSIPTLNGNKFNEWTIKSPENIH